MRVEVVQNWSDNYSYVVVSEGSAFVVDPPEADSVEAKVKELGVELTQVLVTHHHADHTGGCRGLKKTAGCEVIGPPGGVGLIDRVVKGRACSPSAPDFGRLGDPSLPVNGEELDLNGLKVSILSVPGHTSGDVAYWLSEEKIVFTGDTLFAGGCGRVFGGDYKMMWHSLMRLRELPDDTLVYCGHEYTIENLQFALQLEPCNQDVSARLKAEQEKLRNGEPTVPSNIALEKLTNPFFRADTEQVASAVDMQGAESWEVFAKVRKLKDRF